MFGKYGEGNGIYLLDDVECKGTETSLEDCEHRAWGQHDCLSFETAGVVCTTQRGNYA